MEKKSISQYFKSNSIVIICAFDDRRSDHTTAGVAAVFQVNCSSAQNSSIPSTHTFPRGGSLSMLSLQLFGIKQVIFSASLKN